jgi:protein-tyrosine-phosphatase
MATRQYADLFQVDTAAALHGAADRLHDEFDGTFSIATIERFLHDSFAPLAARATISRFAPLIAERQARALLLDVARAAPEPQGRPIVLFVSVHDVTRSAMAQGFLRHIAGNRVAVWSGGAVADTHLDASAVAVMDEVGILLEDSCPPLFTDDTVRAADVVVTLGSEPCPLYAGHRYRDWSELDVDATDLRATRDSIGRHVRHLASELGLAA